MGGVGGPCDFSVSPSPFGLDFGTLDYGTSDLGLTIVNEANKVKKEDSEASKGSNWSYRITSTG